jgi:TRAP-type C4-dicarboxylate transport system permease small subunit
MLNEYSALPSWYRSYKQFNDVLSAMITIIGEIIVGVSSLIILAAVLLRNIKGFSAATLLDFPPLLMPWLVFLLMAKLLRNNQHIKVDAIQPLLGERGEVWVELMSLMFSVVICVGLCLLGISGVLFFSSIGQSTYTEIAIPLWYVQGAFPVGFFLAANFSIEGIIGHLLSLSRQSSTGEES